MKEGKDDPSLAALLFQFGRYLVISSSRPGTHPPNLQGIWNGDRNPEWDCKYTSNINLQMNYYPVDVANLGECIEPLLRMAEELTVTGGWAARHCYGARGWTLGFNTDLWRGAWPPLCACIAGAISGRPGLDFHRQKSRKAFVCHFLTVAGFIT